MSWQLSGAAPTLIVGLAGVEHELVAGRGGTVFGRNAELDIDSNPFLHRQIGRFVDHAGLWWIGNLGSWMTLCVESGSAVVTLPPGARLALTEPTATVCFEAGSCNYELHVRQCGLDPRPEPPPPAFDCTVTCRPVDLPLTAEQRLLLLVLAETRLRNPASRSRLPLNRDAAARLGWSLAKFNRKLDWLCQRLDRAGVPGLRATGRRSNDRRERLVEFAIDHGIVSAADLDELPDAAVRR